nr:ABC transporter permease [Agrobacterium vitis]
MKRNAARVARSLLRNALQAVPTMFVIVTLGFFILKLAPGDAADFLAAESGSATEESVSALRRQFGLDLPILDQLWNYYRGLAHFSLGTSARFGVPVSELISERIPATLSLMATALVLAVVLGQLNGTIMALTAGRWPDRFLSVLSLLFYSVPSFWIGLMLIVVFSVGLGWLPSGGASDIGGASEGFAWFVERIRYLILPATSLGLYYLTIYARLTRAAVIEASSQDHVRTAISKGLSQGQVVRRHILRNALGPITAIAGTHAAGMLGGAVVVETVFSWPGMGRLAYETVLAREYTVLLGILIVCSAMVIAVNALVDVVQALLDPRVTVR